MKNSKLINALNLFIVLIILVLLVSCSEDVIEQAPEVKIESEEKTIDHIEGKYIVVVSKESALKNQKAASTLEELTEEINKMSGAKVNMKYRLSLTGFAAELTKKQVALLQNDKRVISVYQDRLIYLEETNTQEYPTWGLDRLDQRDGLLDRAYSYNATGAGVNAYIMDSGIRYSHEEFNQRASLGVDLVKQYPDEEYDKDDPDLEPGNDCGGHGTHVAGTVGGTKYGVAKNVNLISVRVFSCVGITSLSRIIMAVDWITEYAVEPAVVNMSLGGGIADPLDLAVENSIASGIHYVLAAGNNKNDACNFSPARTPGALTVGASTINNERASFSNYGDCLDIYAPGKDIVSASHIDDTSVKTASGTSMAAPHVAGLAALYLQKNPGVSSATLHDAIIENSTEGMVREVLSGPTNLAHSLWEPVEFTTPTPPDLNLKAIGIKEKGSNKIYLVWEPTEDPFIHVYRNGSYFANWYNTGEYALNVNGGGKESFQICEANYNNCSEVVTPNFNDDSGYEPNKPPTASFTYEINGLQVSFTDMSTDPDGSIIAWTWYFGDGYYTTAQNPVRTYFEPGTYRVQLQVEDNFRAGDYITEYITLTIEDPNGPDPIDPDPEPSPEEIILTGNGYKVKGYWQTDLSWTPAGTSSKVDIYQNGELIVQVNNTGNYTDVTENKGSGSLTYEICEAGSKTICSNIVTVNF